MADWVILGCGYVGTRLAHALLDAGQRVRVCARNVGRLAPLVERGAHAHAFDAAKSRAFGPALYGTSNPVVVYSVPPVPGMPPGEAIRRAGEACLAVGAQRFVYLSSTAVYGETPDGDVVDEDTPSALGDGEAMVRIAEEVAVESVRLAGVSTIVLRLAAIYGPGRGVRERLKKGNYKLIDEGEHFFSRVHVDDIVGVIRAAADKAPSQAVYCVADDRSTTQREYAEWLTKRLGVPLPPSVASLAPGAPRRPVRNRKVSNARLKRELQYQFLYPSFVEGEMAIEREAGGVATTASDAPATTTTAAAPTTAPATTAPITPVPAPAPAPTSAAATTTSATATTSATTATAASASVNEFDAPYGKGETEYERYLRTAELLQLQKAPEARSHPDELLFQTVHQVEELWMKSMVHDLGEVTRHLDGARYSDARHALQRVAELGLLLERQLMLFETMLPGAYLVIRKGLGRGSGLDSPGFVRLNEVAPLVYAAFERALARHDIDLMKLYAKPDTHPPLREVAEGLVDFDAAMQRFKREHIMVVRRIIGIGTASLRGNPMDVLERSAQLSYFPALWAVRVGMFSVFKVGSLDV
jgi:tryptophan 2,3-dioxygenase